MTQTRIYLDVDGVLNALSKTNLAETSGWPEESWSSKKIRGYIIRWSSELVGALNTIDERDDVEFIWLTTWGLWAKDHISPGIGINGSEWRYLTDGVQESSIHGFSRTWWKLIAIQEDVEEFDGTILWIDDDFSYYPDAMEWAVRKGVNVIQPHWSSGLTEGHVELINSLLDSEV